jgi:hypothetical protein
MRFIVTQDQIDRIKKLKMGTPLSRVQTTALRHTSNNAILWIADLAWLHFISPE